jgi:hypothetical protein
MFLLFSYDFIFYFLKLHLPSLPPRGVPRGNKMRLRTQAPSRLTPKKAQNYLPMRFTLTIITAIVQNVNQMSDIF